MRQELLDENVKQTKAALERSMAKALAEHLPEEVLHNALAAVLERSLANFKIEDYTLRDMLTKRIEARVVELLNTTHKDQFDAVCQRVAHQGLSAITFR